MRRIVERALLFAGCALALGCSGGAGIPTPAPPAPAAARALALPRLESRPGSEKLVEESPPESSRLDRFGDALPPHALARVGTLRWWHCGDEHVGPPRDRRLIGNPSAVLSLALSPDGKVLASGGRDGLLQLWDAATGKRLRHFQEQAHAVFYVAFTPDGKTLVSAGEDGVVRLWDVASKKERFLLGEFRTWMAPRGHERPIGIRGVAMSPDGKLLAATDQTEGARLLRVWQVDTGEELRWSGKPLDAVGYHDALAFGPDGKTLFGYGTSGVRRWRVRTGAELDPLSLPVSDGNWLECFSPGARFLAIGYHDRLSLLEVATGKEVRRLPVGVAAFSADGRKVAAVSYLGTVQLWDLTTGRKAPHSFAHRVQQGYDVQAAILGSEGKALITGSEDGTIRVWDTPSGRCRSPVKERQGKVTHVLFSPDGKYLVTAVHDGGALTLCDAATGKEVRALEPSPEPIHSLAFSPDGRFLATACEGPDVRLLDTATGKLRHRWQPFRFPRPGLGNYVRANTVAFSPDGKALAAVADSSDVFVWDVATGNALRHFSPVGEDGLVALAFSPDGRTLAVAGGNRVRFVNASTGETLPGPREGPAEGNPRRNFYGIRTLLFPADGTCLKMAGGSGAHLWVEGTNQPFHEMEGHASYETPSMAFSPDGKMLVTAGDQAVRIWEVTSGLEIRHLRGHRAGVFSVAFSPDGRAVASGSADTTALVWDVTGRRKDGRFRGDRLSPAQAASLWRDLTAPEPSLPKPAPGQKVGDGIDTGPRSEVAARAHDALWALVAAPEQALPLLEDRLGRILAVKRPPAEPLIADLDSDDFATRASAEKELGELGRRAEPALRKALAKQPPLEVRRRIERLLARLEDDTPLRRRLRAERVTQVLEQINTPRARRLLEHVARSGADPDLTREAKAALSRLARRP